MKTRAMFVQTLFILLSFSTLHAQPPYNQEFQVYTLTDFSTDFNQIEPCVTSLSDGGFVFGWVSCDYWFIRNYAEIFAQRFDMDGKPIGTEFLVNTYTDSVQTEPCVIDLSDGGFVFVWVSYGEDGSKGGIYAKQFDKDGIPVGNEFQVNTYTFDDQNYPCATSLSDGGFVIGWMSRDQDGSGEGIFARRYKSDGHPTGSEFQVNTYTKLSQSSPCVISLLDGGFVFGWESDGQDGSRTGIFAQRYDSEGKCIGSEFQVNIFTELDQNEPCVTSLSDGGFLFGWKSWIRGEFGFGIDGIFACRFDKEGNPIGTEFRVDTYNEDLWYIEELYSPCVSALLDGGFVFGWESSVPIEDYRVYWIFAQRFDKNGKPLGSEFRVNTYTEGDQNEPCVTGLSDGGFIFGWKNDLLVEFYDEIFLFEGIVAKYCLEIPIRHTLVSFDLLEPLNNATIQIYKPTFYWQEASDVRKCYPFEIEYSLLLSPDKTFSNYSRIDAIDDTTYWVSWALQTGKTYFWKVLAKSFYGDSLWSSKVYEFFVSPDARDSGVPETKNPEGFTLEQNYPNPFNPSTEIKYTIPSTGFVRLMIYDIQGRLIRVLFDGNQTAGSYSLRWDGKDELGQDVSSGIYVYKLSSKNAQGQTTVISRKMGLVR